MIRHEEALRVHGLCRILRKMDILQDVLVLTHRRSLDMYSQLDREDDFDETAEAPEVQCECLLRGWERCASGGADRLLLCCSSHPAEPRDHPTRLLHRPGDGHLPEAGENYALAPPQSRLLTCLTCGCLLLQGPLSVFCARARWGPVHVICLRRREGGLGLTLRGDSPVLVAGVVPGGCAAVRGPWTI